MRILRKHLVILFLWLFTLSACTSTLPSTDSSTRTPHPDATENAPDVNTPIPAASNLNVQREALRGVRVKVWHPWFGAQASLLESQVAQFNTENEWGIIKVPHLEELPHEGEFEERANAARRDDKCV